MQVCVRIANESQAVQTKEVTDLTEPNCKPDSENRSLMSETQGEEAVKERTSKKQMTS